MKYFKLDKKIQEVKKFAENGLKDIKSSGIHVLDGYLGLKLGYPLFIAGAAGDGKTEILLEILYNTSKLHDWKHFIYSGEGGNIEHIYSELLHKYLEKPYSWATEKEKIHAEMFVDSHFVVCNHDNDFTFDEFYLAVSEAEKEFDIKFNTTSFDPFNDFNDDIADQKYLSAVLKKVRISSKLNNRIDILVNHVADVKAVWDKDEKVRYTPFAMASEWAGGKIWHRRGFTMLLIYRPSTLLKDAQGMPYADNEAHIYIQKAKPKGVSKVNKTNPLSIFWDWKKNRYYCYEGSQQLYSCETMNDYLPKSLVESKMQPNVNFSESVKEDNWEQQTKVT